MSDPHRYWQELAAAALVGTDRGPALPAPPAALAGALGGAAANPAEDLLRGAAAAALYLRAGALPGLATAEPIAPCPAEELQPCGPRAARHLGALLQAQQRPVLREWLAALAASGRRLPDAALPTLLELAQAERELRPLVLATLGGRGRWLAGLNPAWAFVGAGGVAAPQDEAALNKLWQTGARNGRMFLLQALRAADPARARALLESTWASEKADDRAAFVEALGPGLSMADEPFLEAALDDRGKEVRANAAALLARLPESRLAGRMAERALALVSYRGGLLARIELRLPEACDRATQRDGVDPKPRRGAGERAWWLGEIVARTPPAAWGAAWSVPPATILATRAPKEWRDLLVGAWSAAAVAYGDREWAAALAALALKEPERVPLGGLLPLLPEAQRDGLLLKLLDEGRRPLTGNHPALPALTALGGPWSERLAHAVIAALGRRLARGAQGNPRDDWALRAALDGFALAIPPELADEAIRALPAELEENPYWAPAAQAFAERLRLRRDMLLALRQA